MDISTVAGEERASSPTDNQEWTRLCELQQAVLLYLTVSGSAKWGALYSHFDDGTGEVGEALEFLAQRQHIEVEADGTASITSSGAERLKSRKEILHPMNQKTSDPIRVLPSISQKLV